MSSSKKAFTQPTLSSFVSRKTLSENLEIPAAASNDVAVSSSDIGHAMGIPQSDESKKVFLDEFWRSDCSYQFPWIEQGSRSRRFNCDWFKNREWLTYTEMHGGGGVCVYCVLFGDNTDAPQGGILATGAFGARPFIRYKDGPQEIQQHSVSNIHVIAEERVRHFKATMINPEKNIKNLLIASRLEEVKENRRRLIAPIETVIFLCRQGLSLRGHRDSGALELDENKKKNEGNVNDGNFREALCFRCQAGDETLKEHLKTAAANTTYLSPNIQNEIIEVCGTLVVCEILNSLRENCFSLLANETTDVAGIKQLSSLRYCSRDDDGK